MQMDKKATPRKNGKNPTEAKPAEAPAQPEGCNPVANPTTDPEARRQRVVGFVGSALMGAGEIDPSALMRALDRSPKDPKAGEAAAHNLGRLEEMAGAAFVVAQVGYGALIAPEIDAAPADGTKDAVVNKWAIRLKRSDRTVRQLAATYRRVRDGQEDIPKLVELARGGWKAFIQALAVPRENPAPGPEPSEECKRDDAIVTYSISKMAGEVVPGPKASEARKAIQGSPETSRVAFERAIDNLRAFYHLLPEEPEERDKGLRQIEAFVSAERQVVPKPTAKSRAAAREAKAHRKAVEEQHPEATATALFGTRKEERPKPGGDDEGD